MKNESLKWHQKEHTKKHRGIGTVIDGMFFGHALLVLYFIRLKKTYKK